MSDSGTGLAVIIMAAGKGTRMNDPDTAKVMFQVGGSPMIRHVVAQGLRFGGDPVVVVIGHRGDSVRSWLTREFTDTSLRFAWQKEQLGTAHAVAQAVPLINGFDGTILVLSGDVPLLTDATVRSMIEQHESGNNACTVLTVEAPDPTGYGRIVRNDEGNVERIVEHKDASQEERRIKEINAGVYLFKRRALTDTLPLIDNDNVQGEYYLPDVLARLIEAGEKVGAFRTDIPEEIQGINTPDQLAEANRLYRESPTAHHA